jgi:hypothetical protein
MQRKQPAYVRLEAGASRDNRASVVDEPCLANPVGAGLQNAALLD